MVAALARQVPTPVRHGAMPERPLRFLTCGSVDDGKSTLIGRLLWDTFSLKADQREAIMAGGEPDFARALDGLEAEREQGITIDVAWRYFSSGQRAFIVADTPGHVQYTRNMATGASSANAAIILVDARLGVLEQTRRHTSIVALMGVGSAIFVINKMDLVGYSAGRFAEIEADIDRLARSLGMRDALVLPLAALTGENLAARAANLDWFAGPTLLEALESVDASSDLSGAPFRFPVQRVARPDSFFRGYQGTVAAGTVRPGDVIAAGGHRAKIARIVAFGGDVPEAKAGDAVTLTLDREIDLARGDLVSSPENPPSSTIVIEADLVSLDGAGIQPGRRYVVQTGGKAVGAFTTVIDALDLASGRRESARVLAVNGIGRARLALDAPTQFDLYADNRATGSFILIDPLTNATIAAGMVRATDAGDAPARSAGRMTLVLLEGDAAGFALPDNAQIIRLDRDEAERRLAGLWGDGI
jgi:sulfate adenylyltransferase subunit 1